LSDGPAGVRGIAYDERDPSINLPSPTAFAATWDEALIGRVGALLAAEARRKGVDVLLGPSVNLQRSPGAGRHFECFSEDPLLSGRIAAAYVRGVQGAGVGATVKHYVGNDSETERETVDVHIDERALNEVYLAPFEHVVTEAAPWLVMAAYNGVNGAPMTENPLLRNPLQDSWGFDGVVVSDWAAAHTTEATATGALGLVMPGPFGPWAEALVAAVREGKVAEADVDDKVRRLLLLAGRVGALDGVAPVTAAAPAPVEADAIALTREVAASAMVLVRNVGGALPLDPSAIRSVAVLGPNASAARTQGGGSVTVMPRHTVSPLEGLRTAFGPDVSVTHAVGARTQYRLERLSGADVVQPDGTPGMKVRFLDAEGIVIHEDLRTQTWFVWMDAPLLLRTSTIEASGRFVAREPGPHRLGLAGIGTFRMTVDGETTVDEMLLPEGDFAAALLAPPERSVEIELAAGQEVELHVTYTLFPGSLLAALTVGVERPFRADAEELAHAVELARQADVAVVVVGTTERAEREGSDRETLALPGAQDDLVRAVAAVNPRTVVVVNSGGPVLTPWRDEVAAVLLTWFPGQEYGNALASVLLGDVEPGGRLPTTWPASDTGPAIVSTRPVDGVLAYTEGIHLGYRGWLKADAEPAFPFGSGWGYTEWSWLGLGGPTSCPAGEDVQLTVQLRNDGARPGREVVQVYLSRSSSAVDRPARWLAGFAVVDAEPGQTVSAVVRIAGRAFGNWDSGWRFEPGAFDIAVGRSVADLPLTATVTLT
jgi:beta-glucosidase